MYLGIGFLHGQLSLGALSLALSMSALGGRYMHIAFLLGTWRLPALGAACSCLPAALGFALASARARRGGQLGG